MEKSYSPRIPDISFKDNFYRIDFHKIFRRYSNSPFNGGIGISRYYINRHVPIDYNDELDGKIADFLKELNLEQDLATVSLTACDTNKGIHRLTEKEDYFVHLSITGGTKNALSIGSEGFRSQGTINIALITDATLSDSSALNLFQDIIEAKSQALNDSRVTDSTTGMSSPGTSTDSLSLFVGNSGRKFPFAGRLTEIGKLASVMVYEAVVDVIAKDCT